MDLLKLNNNKKTISLDDLKKIYNTYDHEPIVEKIKELIRDEQLSPMAVSKNNPLTPNRPRIVNKFKIITEVEQCNNEASIEEIKFSLHHKINTDYYLKNLKQYKAEREYILKISDFLQSLDNNEDPISLNERSYTIFTKEKFLSSSEGRSLVNKLGLSPEEDFNVYLTPEPFFHISFNSNANQKTLIVENKDTYISLKKLAQMNKYVSLNVLGKTFDTIIYGEGKKISSSFNSINENYLLDYLKSDSSEFYYWGDIDIEGIRIYHSLIKKYNNFNIQPFKEAYELMVKKSHNIKLTEMEKEQKGQVDVDILQLSAAITEEIKSIIGMRLYIPQEIITYLDIKNSGGKI